MSLESLTNVNLFAGYLVTHRISFLLFWFCTETPPVQPEGAFAGKKEMAF
jgi:hypothetical protein